MTSVVEKPPESKLVKAVRVFARVVVLRVRVVVTQTLRVDGIEVGRVRFVKDFRSPRSLLRPHRFGKVDSVEERM